MEDMPLSEKPLPFRKTEDDKWEVENSHGHWTKCESEGDARAISNAPLLLERSFLGPCNEIAAELEATSAILEKYSIGFGSRFFKNRANIIRND